MACDFALAHQSDKKFDDPIPSEAVDAARREGRGIITKNDAHGQENCGSVYQ